MLIHVPHNTDHPDGGGRIDGAAIRLVIQTDVAAYDRRAERFAGFGHPLDALGELVVAVRLLGTTEVQAIRYGHGLRTDAREIPVRFGDRGGPAASGIEVAVSTLAVCGGGEAEIRALTRTTAASAPGRTTVS